MDFCAKFWKKLIFFPKNAKLRGSKRGTIRIIVAVRARKLKKYSQFSEVLSALGGYVFTNGGKKNIERKKYRTFIFQTGCNLPCYGETKAKKTYPKNVPIKTYLKETWTLKLSTLGSLSGAIFKINQQSNISLNSLNS